MSLYFTLWAIPRASVSDVHQDLLEKITTALACPYKVYTAAARDDGAKCALFFIQS
jgi:hypothetical protein